MSAGKKNSGSSSVNNVFHIDKITFVWRHEASFGKLLQGLSLIHISFLCQIIQDVGVGDVPQRQAKRRRGGGVSLRLGLSLIHI